MRTLALLLALASSAQAADTYTKTKYPIVLVHGMAGFDNLLGVYDYFYGLPSELRSGGAKVYVVDLSAVNSTELRGEQLVEQLDDLRALTGAAKFNLIGHSQGGLTARYAASVRPDLVASVTTIGTPHRGSAVADAINSGAPEGTPQHDLLAAFFDAVGLFVAFLSDNANPQDSLAALGSLTSSGAVTFNARHPAGAPTSSCGAGPASANGIRYYSMGGTAVATNFFDSSDALLISSSVFFGFTANDGLVSECSSKWGTVTRSNYPWNHLDEVNQIAGLRGLFTPSPASVYRAQANRLKSAGL